MKTAASFMSLGLTVAGTFFIAWYIGNKTGHLGIAFIIAGLFCVAYIIELIRRELK